MFWGLTLMPGEPCTKVMEKSVCLSMAALESRQTIGSGFTQVLINVDGVDHLLCTLMCGVIFQQYMNVNLAKGEKITLSVEGTGVVHLTGFTMHCNRQNENDTISEEVYYSDFERQLQDGHEYSVKVGNSFEDEEGWEAAPDTSNLTTTDTQSYTESAQEVWSTSNPKNNVMLEPSQVLISEPSDCLDLQEASVQGVAISRDDAVQDTSHRSVSSEGDWNRTTETATNVPGFFHPRRPLQTKPHSDAEEEDIEERRRRWRLAKREQRKKNKLKALMAQDIASKPSGQGYSRAGNRHLTPSGRYRSLPASRESVLDPGQRRFRKWVDNHSQDSPSTSGGPQH